MKETLILRKVIVWDNRTKHQVEIDVDVDLDIDVIARQLANKAYNNSSRKSRACGGLVEVKMRGAKAVPIVREKETA